MRTTKFQILTTQEACRKGPRVERENQCTMIAKCFEADTIVDTIEKDRQMGG